MDWTSQFPKKFRENKNFNDLKILVDSISNHEAMLIRQPYVLHNMIRVSLVFTVCFYGNLLATLRHIIEAKYVRHPFSIDKDNKLLHLFLELSSGELATNNIFKDGYSPHYVPMLNAAKQAGINTTKIENFVKLVEKQNVKTICKNLKFSKPITDYLVYSNKCTKSLDRSFATIALREITLSINFNIIHKHLPKGSKYNGYRKFLSTHINLDIGEHGKLMSEALSEIKSGDEILQTMIKFYTLRKLIYDACLSKAPIF